ncbi:MAG: hypothetical protein EP317_04845, partial [Bacillota bacterium]
MRYLKLVFLSIFILFIVSCKDNEVGELETYTLSFDFLDVDYSLEDILNIEEGMTIDLPNVTLEHYDFNGWYYMNGEEKVYVTEVILSSDLLVYADLSPKTYDINFYIFDEHFTTVSATYLSDVVIPDLPELEGYIITGWDSDLNDIDGDMDVHAILEKKSFTVNFYLDSLENELIHTQQVLFEESAIAPENPTLEGNTFVSWDADFSSITEDLNVHAMFSINVYTVYIYDIDGDILDTQTISHGGNISLPNPPEVLNHIFVSWDGNSQNITEDTHIYAIYENLYPELRGVNLNPIVEFNDPFDPLEGITAWDAQDLSIPKGEIVVDGYNDSMRTQLGDHTYTLSVTDSDQNTTTITITLTIIWGHPSLHGVNKNPYVYVGDSYDPLDGVTATDPQDGDVTDLIDPYTFNPEFLNTPGVYIFQIFARDTDGKATGNIIKLTVLEISGPNPEFFGVPNEIEIDKGDELDPLDNIVVMDYQDGNITDQIIVTGWNETYIHFPGEYDITLSVEDSDGNITTAHIIVIVNDNYYSKTETFNTYLSDLDHLNPHMQTDEKLAVLFELISDTLYRLDFDWQLAIDLGIAMYIGDFTHTENLPFTYVPSMANGQPVDVGGQGLVWEISLRNDLSFIDGTVITSETFNYSYQQLLSPLLLNANAFYLMDELYLPLINAMSYRSQFSPLQDSLGFPIYIVGDITYQRDYAYYGLTAGGFDIYHVENKYETLTGPGGIKAYVEFWGSDYDAYGQNGWVLETENDTYFRIGTDNNLYAPGVGWTLDGNPVPSITDLPQGVTLKSGGAGYAGAVPAYMDELGNRVATDEDGIPVEGSIVYADETPIAWSSVGFEVIDEYTFRLHLTTKKSSFEVMENLSKVFSTLVHPTLYENGINLSGTSTNYGTLDNPAIAYGRYMMSEWIENSYISFEINDEHFDHEAYRIKSIRYDFVDNQDDAVLMFRQGLLDEVNINGQYYMTYMNSPYVKLSPSTTFLRFAFSIDRMNDGDPSNDNPMMKYLDFRKALYFATNREDFVKYVRSPGYPTQGLLGPSYFSGEQNVFSYRGSLPGQNVLADFAPETYGYDPVLAKALFDQAYQAAVTNGDINDGDVVSVVFNYDLYTSHDPYTWLEQAWENIFGDKFDLVLNRNCTTNCGQYDMVFGGWQGLQFNAPSLLQVYSNVKGAAYMLEIGFETGNAVLEVELGASKVAVQAWLDELLLVAEPTSAQAEYIDLFEEFLADFTGNIYTNTYDYIWETVYYTILDYDRYEGREDDFDRITAALEGELLGQMINIPLLTSVSAVTHSSNIIYDLSAYHGRMGWGGYRYMYIA